MTWKKQPADSNTYLFADRDQPFGEMRFDPTLTAADCSFGDLHFRIYKKGFWATTPQIVLSDGTLLLETRNENWYGSTQLLHCGTKIFKARWQNTPLAELIVYEIDRKHPLLSARLKTEGCETLTDLEISDAVRSLPELPYLLAYIWYSFLPVSAEGMDNDTLILLAAGA